MQETEVEDGLADDVEVLSEENDMISVSVMSSPNAVLHDEMFALTCNAIPTQENCECASHSVDTFFAFKHILFI